MLLIAFVPLDWLQQRQGEREHSDVALGDCREGEAHPKFNWHYASSIPTLLDRFNYKVAYTGMADIYRTGIEP